MTRKTVSSCDLIMITVGCKCSSTFLAELVHSAARAYLMFMKHPNIFVVFLSGFTRPRYILAKRFCIENAWL